MSQHSAMPPKSTSTQSSSSASASEPRSSRSRSGSRSPASGGSIGEPQNGPGREASLTSSADTGRNSSTPQLSPSGSGDQLFNPGQLAQIAGLLQSLFTSNLNGSSPFPAAPSASNASP